MADQTTPVTPETPTPADLTSFASLLGAAVAEGIAKTQPPKKVTIGEYTRRQNAGRPKLRRETFHNGYELHEHNLTIKELTLLNLIDRSGRYVDRKVEVIVREEGLNEVVEIRNRGDRDGRADLALSTRSFEDLLQQVVDAQAIERKDAEDLNERKEARKNR